MSDALLIGVDVGTQSAKATLFDIGGRSLAEATAPLLLHRRGPDEVDQDRAQQGDFERRERERWERSQRVLE